MHLIDFLTFYAGVCFGEIALLGSGNMNRRTANVRAHGFTTLYVLFKEDLVDALRDYPEDKARITLFPGYPLIKLSARFLETIYISFYGPHSFQLWQLF